MAKIDKITIENAKTCSKNFSGEVTMYNAGGNRKFSVILDEDLALELIDDGWSIKAKPGKEDGDPMRYYLDVTVKYGKFPPVIKLVTSKGITTLDEDTVSKLDGATITNADLVITPYDWEFNGRHGTKAYLKTGYFTIEEDEFASKYEAATSEML